MLLLDISGPPKVVQANYKKYVQSARWWNYKKGIRVDVTRLFRRKKHVFTTPEKGTCCTVVKYKKDTITFIKQGRYWWVKAYCIDGKVHELKPDGDQKNYIECSDHTVLSFGGNHHDICNGDPGGSLTGLRYLRKAFTSIIEGGERIDPKFVGLFVVYLGEGPRFEIVFQALYMNIPSPNSMRLDYFIPWMNELVRNWNKLSEYAMKYMHCLREGLELPELDQGIAFPGMDSIEKVLELVKILQLDAYNAGIFSHEKAQQPDVWRARDESFARKEKDTHCKKKHGKGAPPPEDSFIPMDDDLFHLFNVNGKVQSLFVEKPPASAQKLSQGDGWFSNKAEVSSSSSHGKRKMSTIGYNNKVCKKLNSTQELIFCISIL